MKPLGHKLLLYILAGALLIVALAVVVYFVDASESHATWLPLVLDTGGELHEDPCPPAWQVGGGCLPPAVTPEYPPTPTMAPTSCAPWNTGDPCQPTPTPFVVTVEP